MKVPSSAPATPANFTPRDRSWVRAKVHRTPYRKRGLRPTEALKVSRLQTLDEEVGAFTGAEGHGIAVDEALPGDDLLAGADGDAVAGGGVGDEVGREVVHAGVVA